MEEKKGKIDQHIFEELIQQRCGFNRKTVRVGPGFGVDVAIIDLPGEMALATTSDPLSLIPSLGLEESAWLSVHLMANDMATTGFAPMYGQFVLNLPSTFSKSDFEIYWGHIHRFCLDIGLSITGGHTGFVEGQQSTIAGGGTFFTIAPKSDLLVSSFAQVGDSILITKACAISSTAILAMSFPETVKQKLGKETYQEACELFYQSSSLPDALVATGTDIRHSDITAMHDVTEGGVLGALYEMCVASGNGAWIEDEKIPLGNVQQEVCSLFDLDPRHCIGAGSMVITCKPGTADTVIRRLNKQNIPCTEIGVMKGKSEGIKLQQNGKLTELDYKEEDPYWAAFFKALKSGWK